MADAKYNKIYRIPTSRAVWGDYSVGMFFVTICTAGHIHYFGEIVGGEMRMSDLGRYAAECWININVHFPHVESPLFVIMPNHVHGILVLRQQIGSCGRDDARNRYGGQSRNLASVIRGYKSVVTAFAKANAMDFAWQPRYYDHIIRNVNEMNSISNYIQNNIAKWDADEYNNQ